MTCTGNGERELQLTAYLDGELDLTSTLELERHLEACPVCARQLAAQRALRQAIGAADLRFRPTAQQARRLRKALGTSDGAPMPAASRAWQYRQLRAAAAILLVAAGAAAGWTGGRLWPAGAARQPAAIGAGATSGATGGASAVATTAASGRITDEQVLASHLRGQLSGRPEDVVSSDRHTVKPWFAGRLDYAPTVVDLAARGFPLRGGRLDYVGGRPVAALVYQAGNHVVSVLTWPAGPGALRAGVSGGAGAGVEASSLRGFQMRRWTQAAMTWWAVSDVSADRLDELVRDLRAELPR